MSADQRAIAGLGALALAVALGAGPAHAIEAAKADGPDGAGRDAGRAAGGAAGAGAGVAAVEVAGTAFRLTLADGRVVAGEGLAGAVLDLADGAGGRLDLRIDAVAPDPGDPGGEVLLHAFKVRDGDGGWRDLCTPGPDGRAAGFPLAGAWTAEGVYLPSAAGFTLTCTSGVVGKCIRMGYKPWATAADGRPLLRHFQACTRMMRADYCGDGVPRTRDGTGINIYDRIGVQAPDPSPGMAFEAGWGPDGAVCVRHARVPDAAGLAEIVRACPGKLAGRVGPAACSEAAALRPGGALVLNESAPPPVATDAPPRRRHAGLARSDDQAAASAAGRRAATRNGTSNAAASRATAAAR